MAIKAVIFDADGVVIFPWRFAEYLEREHQLTRDDTADFFGGPFPDCLVGRADLKEVLPPYLDRWAWPHSLDDFLQRWFEEEHAIDERIVSAVGVVREHGIFCAVASNQERYRAEYMRSQMGFDTLFDATFFSSDIGHMKPDLQFYDHITQSLNLPPGEILFWDDSPHYIAGAQAYGWNAELYKTYELFQGTFTAHVANWARQRT